MRAWEYESMTGGQLTDPWWGIRRFPPVEGSSDEGKEGERKVTHSHLLFAVWSSFVNHKQVSFSCFYFSIPLIPLPLLLPLCGVLKPEKQGINTGAMIQPDPSSREQREEIPYVKAENNNLDSGTAYYSNNLFCPRAHVHLPFFLPMLFLTYKW